jgi:hypothetical protein
VFAAAVLSLILVFVLGGQLPTTVASHFGASGKPDGHASRELFVFVMAGLNCAVPVLIWWLQDRAIRSGKPKIPNPEFWLSAERKQATHAWLHRHAAVFPVATTLFLSFVFWLVVHANMQEPVELKLSLLWPALALYIAGAVAWSIAPHVRFGTKSDA